MLGWRGLRAASELVAPGAWAVVAKRVYVEG
jgi:hypothetical protein